MRLRYTAADACQPATGGWPGGADPASAIRAYFYQGRGLFLTTRYLRRNGPELQMRCSCAQWRRPVQHLERFPVGFAGTSSGARPGRTTPSARPISQPHAVACFRASTQAPGAAPQDPSPLTSASCRPGRSHSVSPAEAEMRSTPALRRDITALPVDKELDDLHPREGCPTLAHADERLRRERSTTVGLACRRIDEDGQFSGRSPD
jgi:hypothetical protein